VVVAAAVVAAAVLPGADEPVQGASGTAPSPGASASSPVRTPSPTASQHADAAAPGAARPAARAARGQARPPAKVLPAGPPLERFTPAELARIAERKAARREARLTKETTLTVGSLNVLGSQHAKGGVSRAAREAALIEDRGLDLVGLQEVQPDQQSVFVDELDGYTVWPQDALGKQGYRLQLAWRSDRFDLVDTGSRTHTFDSMPVPLPYVLLEDRETGAQFYAIDAHNSPRDMQGQRLASTGIESDLVNELEDTGLPVLLMGDFNEHESFFCRIASSTGLVSANGGSWSDGCHPPPRDRMRIDWILGSGDLVDFSDYVQDDVTRANGLSDHSLVYADATLTDPPEE